MQALVKKHGGSEYDLAVSAYITAQLSAALRPQRPNVIACRSAAVANLWRLPSLRCLSDCRRRQRPVARRRPTHDRPIVQTVPREMECAAQPGREEAALDAGRGPK